MTRRGAAAAIGAVAVAAIVVGGIIALTTGGSRPRHVHATPASPPAAALPAPAGQAFGVNVNRLFNDHTYAAAQLEAQLAALRATGATLARSDAFWEAAEPHAPVAGQHRYDWSFDDQIAGSLAAQGLTWLPIIDYTAPWAQSVPGQDHSPPRSDADYAAYAGAFAARYGGGGAFWRAHPGLDPRPVTAIEIWNEPDNPEFWEPGPDAAGYAQLYLAARTAIDAAHPGIRVLIGGLTNAAVFLPAMVQAVPGLRGSVDGVAVHPYGAPNVVVARVRGARDALVRLGMSGVPLYITEFGWTTRPPGVVGYTPPGRRPAEITSALTMLGHLRCGLAATLLYTWVTPERDPGDAQDWYGIASPTDPAAGTADTAAFVAGLRAATQPLTGPAPPPCPT
ncbi:MAG: hypothetical protein ACXVRP_13330 [Solirubrobacteraceae bacterium]